MNFSAPADQSILDTPTQFSRGITVITAPEAATLLLLGTGLAGIGAAVGRRRGGGKG